MLTDIEKEILVLICDDLSSKEIADKLFRSKRTIDTHKHNMIKKLGVKSVIGLVKYAYNTELKKIETTKCGCQIFNINI
jgi:DNA-binding NarL/FixJ family response regulator